MAHRKKNPSETQAITQKGQRPWGKWKNKQANTSPQ